MKPIIPARRGDADFLPAQLGGCWFCNRKEPWYSMCFDTEFDTNVHLYCIQQGIKEDNPEAMTMVYLLTEPSDNCAPMDPDKAPLLHTKVDASTKIVHAKDNVPKEYMRRRTYRWIRC